MDAGAPWTSKVNWWGLFFVVGGLLWFLGEMDVIRFSWSLFGPLAIVAVGLTMLFGGSQWGGRQWRHEPACTCTCSCCAQTRT